MAPVSAGDALASAPVVDRVKSGSLLAPGAGPPVLAVGLLAHAAVKATSDANPTCFKSLKFMTMPSSLTFVEAAWHRWDPVLQRPSRKSHEKPQSGYATLL